MDSSTMQFYFLLLFVSSDVLALRRIGGNDYHQSSGELPPVLKNLGKNSAPLLQIGQKKFAERKWTEEAGFDGTASEEIPPSSLVDKGRKPFTPSQDLSRWPSKVDRFAVSNDILQERVTLPGIIAESQKPDRETRRRKIKPVTFDELENRNANIYNPLLNLDHYPIPAKKYTVVELENMNANHYNPYLD